MSDPSPPNANEHELLARLGAIQNVVEKLEKKSKPSWLVPVIVAVIGAASALGGSWIGAFNSRPKSQALVTLLEISNTETWKFYQDSKRSLSQIHSLHEEFCRFTEFSRDTAINSRLSQLYQMTSAAPEAIDPASLRALEDYNEAVAQNLVSLRDPRLTPEQRAQRCQEVTNKKDAARKQLGLAIQQLTEH